MHRFGDTRTHWFDRLDMMCLPICRHRHKRQKQRECDQFAFHAVIMTEELGPNLARNGHAGLVAGCPFVGVKRIFGKSVAMSESDP
jgi:hypothetical protein